MPNVIEIIISGKNEAKAAIADAKADSEGLGSTMTKVGAVSGLALAGIAAESVKMASEFQSSTTRLVTSAGESTANIDMVRKGMLDMASQVGFSANELSKGMYTVESAGYHGADGLTVLKAAAQGAKDENADLAKVSNAVTDVLVDYHMKASDAATVTSQMVTAVGYGKTTFDDFSGAMHNILPLASAAHLSFADVSGVLAEMTAHGMSADQASQNMANAIRSLLVPTGTMQKEFTALGISSDMVKEKLGTVGLAGTMQFLQQTAAKVSPNVLDQDAALKKLMGTAPGLSVALMTTGENAAATAAAIKGIGDSTQDAQGNVKGFSEMQQTLGQRVAELKAGFDSLMIELGDKLIPVISSAVDWMNKHKDVVTDVMVAVGLLAAGIAAYTVVVKLAGVAVAAWNGLQLAFKVAAEASTAATEALGVAMKALPVVAVMAGIGYLADKLGQLSGVGDHTAISVTKLNTAMMGISTGSSQALDAMAKTGEAFANMSHLLGTNVDGLKDYDQSLGQLVSSGHAADAKAIIDKIANATDDHGKAMNINIQQYFPQYQAALDQQQNAAKAAATATDGLSDSQKQAQAVQDSLTSSVAATTSEYDAAKKAATGYQDSLDAMYGKYGSYADAQAKFTVDMTTAATQITKGKDAINLNTDAGAKNFQTLENLSKANMDIADNMIKTGSSADQATAALQKGAVQIDALAKSAGFTKDQIALLNTDLYGVPDVKNITINANTTDAINNIAAMNSAVLNVARNLNSIVGTGKSIKVMPYAHGGEIGAAATGGNRSGLVMVGEDGPELVRLPTGSTVRSNPNTMADLAGAVSGGGAGGAQSVELVLAGADTEFLTWLRKIIRVRGGNGNNSVQKVLGQAY